MKKLFWQKGGKLKILITHVYSQHNKGDTAILSATIKSLKDVFPSAQIKIVTAEKISRSLSYEGLPVLNSFFYFSIYTTKNRFQRIIATLAVLTGSTLWAVIYQFCKISIWNIFPKDLRRTCQAYLEADLILPIGGGYLSGKKTIQSHTTLIIQLHAIWIATLLQKKVILYSQSIGPFSNFFQTFITKKVLNRVDAIFAREDYTMSTLKKIGVKSNVIYRTVDAAFSFTSDQKQRMSDELREQGINRVGKLVGITVRKWLESDKQQFFEKEVANFARYLATEQKVTVVFIPQVTSTLHNDDDRVVNKRIRSYLKGIPDIYFLNKKYSHYEIKGIYESMDYMVGTRMHSIILALTGGVPSIAIEYEYKTAGIMKDLGLSSYVIKIEDVTSERLIRLYKNLQQNRKNYKNLLHKSLATYLQVTQETGKYLQAIYSHRDNNKQHNLYQASAL